MADRKAEARKELARRELAKREGEEKPSFLQTIGRGLKTGAEAVRTEGLAPIAKGASTAAFGLPREVIKDPLRAVGLSKAAERFTPEISEKIKEKGKRVEEFIFPEQETVGGKVLTGAATLRGLVKGGAAKLAQKAGKGVLAKTGSRLAKGATEGAVFGGAQVTDKIDAKKQLKQAVGGGAAGTLLGALGKAKSAVDKSTKGAPAFLNKVRNSVFKRKRQASEIFGKQLDDLAVNNPDRKVSLSQVVNKINAEAAFEPKLNSIINRTPSIKRIVNNPRLADDIPVTEAQKIINDLTAKLPASKKFGFNVNSDDIAVFDVIDDIRASQLDAFPEMAKIREGYGQVLNKYNLIKTKIKAGSLNNQLLKDFGGDPETKEAFKSLVSEDILKEVKSFRNINNILQTAGILPKRIAQGAALTAGATLIGKALFGKK